ncbi:MAG: VRR-NUC domain-containing protein [Anaerolineaceae bacterium]|nr:VRR-NUC domain-containing protein [Anaerolineaceae bacterium]
MAKHQSNSKKNQFPTEHEEQVSLFKWADQMSGEYPALKLLFAIPNGSYKSISAARRFSAEGLRPGVPDICLPVASRQCHALYIEMKRIKGGRISPEQKAWINMLTRAGNLAVVCYGAASAKSVIMEYLGIRKS